MKTARTKLFVDFEFTGLHRLTTPISLGIVADTGDYFYAEFSDYDKRQVDTWLQEHVIANLLYTKNPELADIEHTHVKRLSHDNIYGAKSERRSVNMVGTQFLVRTKLPLWLKQFESVECWLDVGAYDWVLLVDLLADYPTGATDGNYALKLGYPKLPSNLYYLPFDLATYLACNGLDPDLNRLEFAGVDAENKPPHNALTDAYAAWQVWEKVENGKFNN